MFSCKTNPDRRTVLHDQLCRQRLAHSHDIFHADGRQLAHGGNLNRASTLPSVFVFVPASSQIMRTHKSMLPRFVCGFAEPRKDHRNAATERACPSELAQRAQEQQRRFAVFLEMRDRCALKMTQRTLHEGFDAHQRQSALPYRLFRFVKSCSWSAVYSHRPRDGYKVFDL